jgi:hypothetical protein
MLLYHRTVKSSRSYWKPEGWRSPRPLLRPGAVDRRCSTRACPGSSRPAAQRYKRPALAATCASVLSDSSHLTMETLECDTLLTQSFASVLTTSSVVHCQPLRGLERSPALLHTRPLQTSKSHSSHTTRHDTGMLTIINVQTSCCLNHSHCAWPSHYIAAVAAVQHCCNTAWPAQMLTALSCMQSLHSHFCHYIAAAPAI